MLTTAALLSLCFLAAGTAVAALALAVHIEAGSDVTAAHLV